MTIRIGSNISALQANRRLSESTDHLARVFERLSSGQRINRASDDAAGLAVATSLGVDRRVYNRGLRNISDGISLLNIADSALDQLSSTVIRIRELATQSASGSLSREQRMSLDAEAQALVAEFDRIADSTEFNGLNIFDGTIDLLGIQAGYGLDGAVFSALGGNLADGTFDLTQYQSTSASGLNELVDINNDGNLDLLTQGGALYVAYGNGDGTFQEQQTILLNGNSNAVSIGDVNNDGNIDIVKGVGAIEIYLGQGDGTFVEGASYSIGGWLERVEFGDFNGDGNLDVIYGHYDITEDFEIRLGNGDGTFGSESSLGSFSTLLPNDLQVGDVNGDGSLDFVSIGTQGAGEGAGAELRVHLGNGDGTFTESASVAAGLAQSLLVADFNGDGRDDLIETGNGHLSIRLGQADGTLGSATSIDTGTSGYRLALGDFNGDGLSDFAVMGIADANRKVQIFNGDGAGSFSAGYSWVTEDLFSTTFPRILLGDLDGDATDDIVLAGGNLTMASYLANTKSGLNPFFDIDLSSQYGARSALAPLENLLNQLSTHRGEIGAFQSRLGSALNTLSATQENYAAAESRIRDVDISFESAELVRLSILQEAAAAVLAQANTQPEIAVSLLSG